MRIVQITNDHLRAGSLVAFLYFNLFCSPDTLRAQLPPDSISYAVPALTTTASRISESWIATPFALKVIPASDLLTVRGYGIDEAFVMTPGVLAFSRMGNQDIRLTIRGFGARGAGDRSNGGTSRGIRVLSDGFPETEPDGRTSFDLVDLAGTGSLEVLRSNASSIWGNAAGGVVNIRSNTGFERAFARISGSAGSFGFRKDVVESGLFIGSGRLSLALSNMSSDGWREHSRSSNFLLRTALETPLGKGSHLGLYLSGGSAFFLIPGPLTLEQYLSDRSQADSLHLVRNEHRSNRLGRVGFRITHAPTEGQRLTVSAYVNPKVLQRSERNTFRTFDRYHIGGSATYQLSLHPWNDARLEILAGVDEAFQDGAILFYTLSPQGGRGETLRANKREGANNLGVFVEGKLEPDERWVITSGARFDDVTYYGESYTAPILDDKRSFTGVTPKAGIVYKLSPTQSLYASVGGGIEVPAGNETDPVPPDTIHAINVLLDPIVSTTAEIGTKHMIDLGDAWWGGLLTYDVAAYAISIRNDIIPYRQGQFYLTSGLSRRYGLEVGARYEGISGLSVQGSVTLSENHYVEYVIDSVLYDPAKSGITADLGGKMTAGIPSYFYGASLRYDADEGMGFFAELQAQGVGEYYADDRNTILVPSWLIMHGAAGFGPVDIGIAGLALSGHVGIRNILDKAYIGSAWINPGPDAQGRPRYIEAGMPRTWYLSVSLSRSL